MNQLPHIVTANEIWVTKLSTHVVKVIKTCVLYTYRHVIFISFFSVSSVAGAFPAVEGTEVHLPSRPTTSGSTPEKTVESKLYVIVLFVI